VTNPITPPPELVRKWDKEAVGTHFPPYGYSQFIATRAAQWGADQELEACCAFAQDQTWGLVNGPHVADVIRAERRPKPPSLKEQALDAHNRMMAGTETQDDWMIIRRALEQLHD
jgi:hypothetical protein